MLLPLVDLITEARLAVDEVIDRAGRGLIETILTLGAEQVAGAKTPGKASGEVRWPRTVWGCTITRPLRQFDHSRDSQIQKIRSAGRSRGRTAARRWSTSS